jgi:hypothetical protein
MKNDDITLEQKEWMRNVVRDPVLFAIHVLGVKLWQKQIDILQSIAKNNRTAVRSCHGVGKTFTLAVAVLWWLARYKDGIVLTTSPTLRQVRTQLWSEIRRLVDNARVPYPELNTLELKFRGDNNFALGLSTNQAENFQGYHGKHVLIIADEAPGIEAGIWDAIAGIMAGGKVHIVMAGNPTAPWGAFFDAFHRERALWNCIRIDAFDSPNLERLTLDELLRLDPAKGGPLDLDPVPYLVTRRWVYEQYMTWWHGDESSSPNWMSRVRGQFPDQAQNALIKLPWLERAKERALRNPVQDGGGRLVAGVDVGGGEAETVAYICESRPHQHKIIKLGAWRGEDTRGEVVRFLEQYRTRLSVVRVDAIGIGYNFALHLRDDGLNVELINVSLPCPSQPHLGDKDPAIRFANEKARFYQTLADAFEHDEVEGLSDDLTIGQLSDLLYELDSRGRIRIESKEKARERRLSSPDRAEALMLALGKPFTRALPDWMLKDLPAIYRQDDMSKEEIADELDATMEEVETWLKQSATSQAPSWPRKKCAVCCKYEELGESWVRYGSLYYHEACYRKCSTGV